MPKVRKASGPSDLGESWASADYQDESEGDSSSLDTNPWLEDPGEGDLEDEGLYPPLDAMNQSLPQSRTQQQASQASAPLRKSPRISSRSNSVEPSFIMPSMTQDSREASMLKQTPNRLSVKAQRQLQTTPSPRSRKDQKVRKDAAIPSVKQDLTSSRQMPGLRRRAPAATIAPQDIKKDLEPEPFIIFQWLWDLVYPIIRFSSSIIGMMLTMSKPLIATVGMIIAVFLIFRSLQSTIYSALTPICYVPGLSFLPFCNPTAYDAPVEFDQLVNAQSAFEDVLSSTVEIAGLPYDMKRSEASIRDLRSVIEYSSIPSRHELSFEFNNFIQSARRASADLTKFDTHIGGAVDRIISTNRWTLQILASIRDSEASKGSLTRFLSTLNPFPSTLTNQQRILTQYIRHTTAVSEQVTSVILEAQGLLTLLNSLDDRLDTIASIAVREGYTIQDARTELFASLWTKLGGNSAQKRKLDENLKLLQSVGTYQRAAWKHVSEALLKLQEISAQLEDLRERVAAPGNVGVREDLPLDVHIENMLLGVERLDAVRGDSRKVQGELYRKMVGAPERVDKEGNLVEGVVKVSAVAAG